MFLATLSSGIIGLPNAGKSTLFNALCRGGAQVANFPFCTVSPNVGIAYVPDLRLEKLFRIVNPQIVTPATVEVVDVAGLIRGAHKGEGLGNEFLSRIRGIDVLIQVVRCFEGEASHPEGSIDPIRDVETLKIELFLSDLDILQRRLTRLNKLLKSQIKQNAAVEALHKLEKALREGISPLKVISLPEYNLLRDEGFLSLKPMIYVANIGEEDIEPVSSIHAECFRGFVRREDIEVVEMCAKLEAELSEFPEEEKQKLIEEMGIKEATSKLIKKIYHTLNLITFFTITGGKEVKAHAVEKGTLVVDAAEKVHSDMKKGFIKAEVINVDELLKLGDFRRAKSDGKVSLEGRGYEVQDGDVIHFHFAL
ncbi:redox-regulated ATPase YchF [Candidatus Aerophobetes bacterium]|nr:redox-regulated ATPase YchF [Candidatus Aerophobetes bacterium]